MSFVSYPFIFFLIAVLLLFWGLPRRARMPLLLIASYGFYATWSIPFTGIILLSTSFDFWMSHIIAGSHELRTKRAGLVAGLVLNLLILCYFKYTNFLLDSAHSLSHYLNWQLPVPESLSIILPLGISFYTFEAISYMVDVYRGEKPARNWLEYNFYIMYFPHLISGPIIRYQELASQYIKGLDLPSLPRVCKGFELIVLGYLFKVLIADQVAPMADQLFAHPAEATVFASALGMLAFTVQIYFDFMGYTHIARGVSLLLNLEMPLNFNHPYSAGNIQTFWQRWHMSLSSWIRDYLYIPVGGSRGTAVRTGINLLIAMTLCGIWHGAGWTFLLWGLYHGLLLLGHRVYSGAAKTSTPLGSGLRQIQRLPGYSMLACGITFYTVVQGWVLFRAKDLSEAALIGGRLLRIDQLAVEFVQQLGSRHLNDALAFLALLGICFGGPFAVRLTHQLFMPMPMWLRLNVACVLLLLCWIFSGEGMQTFIYFQF